MMNKTLGLVVVAMGLSFAVPASAVTLEFQPVSSQVMVGEQATVDVVVSDLGGALVGGYNFSVSWDPSLFGFVDLTFGSFLDGPTDSFQQVNVAPGSAQAIEVSVGPLSNQDGFSPFSLFSFTLDALAMGTSSLDFFGNIIPNNDYLIDDRGSILATTPISGSLRVGVSEPSLLGLMLLGGGVMAGVGRRRRRVTATA
ncbi:MAG: cohesin domain-containing protein [Pseudomonadota bacterium]